MLGPTITKMSKKAPAPKGGIEKDKKVAMLQADKSNKIPSVIDTAPPHMVTEMQMMKEQMDFIMNALRG